MPRTLLLIVLPFAVVSCGGGEASGTAGCDRSLAEPGEYEGLNVFGDVEEPYWMVVPETYADAAPAPLYLHLSAAPGDHNIYMEAWRPYLDDLDGLMAIVDWTAWRVLVIPGSRVGKPVVEVRGSSPRPLSEALQDPV